MKPSSSPGLGSARAAVSRTEVGINTWDSLCSRTNVRKQLAYMFKKDKLVACSSNEIK